MFNMGNRIACLLALAVQLPLQTGALRSATFFASAITRSPNLKMEGTSRHMAGKSAGDLPQTEEGWRTVLNPQQFRVLREKSTEPSGFSERTPGQLEFELKKSAGTKYPKEGTYDCVACGAPLYTAQSKFDSGCGWPAFYEGVPGAIKEIKDADGRRVEILCSNCDSHLGHVFKNEGFPNPTNERHCVNGICLKYEPKE